MTPLTRYTKDITSGKWTSIRPNIATTLPGGAVVKGGQLNADVTDTAIISTLDSIVSDLPGAPADAKLISVAIITALGDDNSRAGQGQFQLVCSRNDKNFSITGPL